MKGTPSKSSAYGKNYRNAFSSTTFSPPSLSMLSIVNSKAAKTLAKKNIVAKSKRKAGKLKGKNKKIKTSIFTGEIKNKKASHWFKLFHGGKWEEFH